MILIISDSYKIPELEEVSALLASRTIEEGPPELPDCLKERAEERLFYISGDPSSRALLAFRLGFWAKLALDTNGAFECDTTASGSVISALGGLEVCLQGSLSSGQFSRLQALRS